LAERFSSWLARAAALFLPLLFFSAVECCAPSGSEEDISFQFFLAQSSAPFL